MVPIRIALPDMISNSYFPVLAACELGFLRTHGLDASLVLLSPADKAYQALNEGEVDFVGAEAHAALPIFPRWRGMKLICAQAQGMYWFLVMRADIGAKRGDLQCIRGRRIGAELRFQTLVPVQLIEKLAELIEAHGANPATRRLTSRPMPSISQTTSSPAAQK